jgi:hypothetical protein
MFVGAWLTPDIYSQTVGDDASFLLKGAADGINDLVLVEATALTSSQDLSFDDAVFMAEKHLKDEKNFIFFIDVFRCRLNNIRPIPQRVEENGKWSVKTEGVKHSNATEEVMHLNRSTKYYRLIMVHRLVWVDWEYLTLMPPVEKDFHSIMQMY